MLCAALALLAAKSSPAASAAAAASNPGVHPRRDSAACRLVAPAVWPTTPIARRAEIDRLLPLRASCIDSPGYMGVLGALLLEDGDAEEARLWL
ncbi:MAG: hypothetical protein M3Y32_01195, partial [Pseudomonadota bacterium]|nr:hypothetical protein [Pseudomonadota bacterium]